jgi:hypothetical protein
MTLAVVTPSYRNDLRLFTALHKSVLRHTDESVRHYVIVPRRDVEAFSAIVGARGMILAEESIFPQWYVSVPIINRALRILPRVPVHARIAAINLKDPLHPVRGWMMQQMLKMEVCRRLDVDIVLLVDSDVEFVRPVTEASLTVGGKPRLYRLPRAVDHRLPEHMRWHAVSRRLLGLPPPLFPAPDYVSSFSVWQPRLLHALITRIEQVTGKSWMDAVSAQRSFSEWTLYGVFAEELVHSNDIAFTDTSLCHSYWETEPLTTQTAATFVAGIRCDDVAILIQSKSNTPADVRRAALGAFDFSGGEVLASEQGEGEFK